MEMTGRCSTCWFANGDGVSRHCGKCACCPESARIGARARQRTYRLMKVRDLTPAEMREMETLIEAEVRAHEEDERTRYESHVWSRLTDDDGEECMVCGVTWEDCDDDCPGPECTCDGRQEFVCHDIRNEPHLAGCPRWGTPKP